MEQNSQAWHLNFDRARYSQGMNPCQILCLTYYASGTNYCLELEPGWCIPVAKKAIRSQMELGRFLWAKMPKPETVLGCDAPCIVLGISKTSNGYRPIYEDVSRLTEIFSGPETISIFKRHNSRRYTFLLDKNIGSNLAKEFSKNLANGFERQEANSCPEELSQEEVQFLEQEQRSAAAWAQAHERARGY